MGGNTKESSGSAIDSGGALLLFVPDDGGAANLSAPLFFDLLAATVHPNQAFPVVAGVVAAAFREVTTSTFLFFCGDRLSDHVFSVVFLPSSPMFLSLSLVEWL